MAMLQHEIQIYNPTKSQWFEQDIFWTDGKANVINGSFWDEWDFG